MILGDARRNHTHLEVMHRDDGHYDYDAMLVFRDSTEKGPNDHDEKCLSQVVKRDINEDFCTQNDFNIITFICTYTIITCQAHESLVLKL